VTVTPLVAAKGKRICYFADGHRRTTSSAKYLVNPGLARATTRIGWKRKACRGCASSLPYCVNIALWPSIDGLKFTRVGRPATQRELGG
jgi:hypothetical protein